MKAPIEVTIQYFAALREQRGLRQESVTTTASTAEELYLELQKTSGLSLDPKIVRAAVNDTLGSLDQAISSGDKVVFIPPVAGG